MVFGVVHVIIDVSPTLVAAATEFWSRALGWSVGEAWPDHPEFRSFEPPAGSSYLHVQSGEQGPAIHLDVAVDDPVAETSRLQALGATAGALQEHWQTMASPAGLPFCLLPSRPGVIPPPWAAPDGTHVRLVQVCVDVPRRAAEAEATFWRAASGWHWVPSADEAFLGKLHHDGASPVQLLLQRLGESDGATATRAHLDLGTDDVEATVRRLVDLGAVRGLTGSGWVVLTDPVGMLFCVTANPPY